MTHLEPTGTAPLTLVPNLKLALDLEPVLGPDSPVLILVLVLVLALILVLVLVLIPVLILSWFWPWLWLCDQGSGPVRRMHHDIMGT